MNNKNKQQAITKTFFPNGKKHGISSFKLSNLNKELNVKIDKLYRECKNRLKYKPDSKKGIWVTIESPKCCKNYAKFNVDRAVPLRQYFGSDDGIADDDGVFRWSYGVGSGSSTVGGDTLTSTTRPMSNNMKEMCDSLKKMSKFICSEKYCRKNIDFNHVTVLYYMMDSKNPTIKLKPHCDIERTAGDVFKQNNSQEEGTPTVVLTLNDSKTVEFYKRYTSDKVIFESINPISQMKLNHKELFVLQPKDEHVLHRRCKKGNDRDNFTEECCASQFKHGVECKLGDFDNKRKSRLVISVCFRQSRITKKYSNKDHILIDSEGNKVKNDVRTASMIERDNLISKKRLEKEDEKNLNRIHKKLKKF